MSEVNRELNEGTLAKIIHHQIKGLFPDSHFEVFDELKDDDKVTFYNIAQGVLDELRARGWVVRREVAD